MPEYRFYAIKRDGHIAGPPTERDLPNDGAALKEAKRKQMINGHDIEVWQCARIAAWVCDVRFTPQQRTLSSA